MLKSLNYLTFLILDIKFSFTCVEWNVYWNFAKFQVIKSKYSSISLIFILNLAFKCILSIRLPFIYPKFEKF